MTRAVIYISSYTPSAKELGLPSTFTIPPSKPLELREQVCRAYCERMNYEIVGVFRATKAPPEKVEYELTLRVMPQPYHLYYSHRSTHPYYAARDLSLIHI